MENITRKQIIISKYQDLHGTFSGEVYSELAMNIRVYFSSCNKYKQTRAARALTVLE